MLDHAGAQPQRVYPTLYFRQDGRGTHSHHVPPTGKKTKPRKMEMLGLALHKLESEGLVVLAQKRANGTRKKIQLMRNTVSTQWLRGRNSRKKRSGAATKTFDSRDAALSYADEWLGEQILINDYEFKTECIDLGIVLDRITNAYYCC